MDRQAVVVAAVVGFCVAACQGVTQRSIEVPLGFSDYDLVFTVVWGSGMDQQFNLQHQGSPSSTVSSPWIEIFDKPYNSGGTLYVSNDRTTYYVGTSYTLLTIVPSKGTLEVTCNQEALPKRTPLAELLLKNNSEIGEQLDPGAPRVFTYVSAEVSNVVLPEPSIPSRYYEGVRYVGRFGVTDDNGRGRGSGVGFVSATVAPEPRLGMEFSCG